VLDSNIEFTYTYYLILGTLQQIRNWVYAQPYRPDCNFRFKTDRQHWWYTNTKDSGWPITNRLRVSLAGNDPRMSSVPTAFQATNVPRLYICAAYCMANPSGRKIGQLYWDTNGMGDTPNFVQARSLQFPAVNDGQFHIYELNLAATNTYRGLITWLRFDPALGGDTGDYADVAWISSSPFTNYDAVKPALGIRQTNSSIVVSFPARSGAAAGYVSNNLLYDLQCCSNPATGNWQGVPGYTNIVGNDNVKAFTNSPSPAVTLYRVKMTLQ
jgi:hypothetical protein